MPHKISVSRPLHCITRLPREPSLPSRSPCKVSTIKESIPMLLPNSIIVSLRPPRVDEISSYLLRDKRLMIISLSIVFNFYHCMCCSSAESCPIRSGRCQHMRMLIVSCFTTIAPLTVALTGTVWWNYSKCFLRALFGIFALHADGLICSGAFHWATYRTLLLQEPS